MNRFKSKPKVYIHRALSYSLPISIICLLLFVTFRDQVAIQKITDTSIIVLPDFMKQRLLTESDSELMYVDYHDHNLQYYFRSVNEARCLLILEIMKKLIVSLRYNLPEGNYLLSLHDGIHHDYGWPVIGYAAKEEYFANKRVLLIPDPYALMGYNSIFRDLHKGIALFPWRKKIAKVFWRGSATGVGNECSDLNGCDRLKFMNYASKLNFADVGYTSYTEQLNPEFKTRLAAIHSLRQGVSPVNSLAYKYLFDVDGNSCSYTRMAWILYSNSVLLKHKSDKMQWYYPQLQPYVHYLPINADFSNLEEQFLWAEANPKAVKAITANAHKFAKKTFSYQNILKSTELGFMQYHDLVKEST